MSSPSWRRRRSRPQLIAAAADERREAEEAERLEAARAEGVAEEAGRRARRDRAGGGGAGRRRRGSWPRSRRRPRSGPRRAAAELALRLAEKVVGAALEAKPELVLEVTRGALRRLAEPREATLLVNPEDVDPVREAVDEPGRGARGAAGRAG